MKWVIRGDKSTHCEKTVLVKNPTDISFYSKLPWLNLTGPLFKIHLIIYKQKALP